MQSGKWNVVENETSRERNTIPLRPAASATASETAQLNAHPDKQPAPTEATFAAFTWLFGSGCY
jgi:hypothetical protein